jgi:hypothetical protein
MGRKLLFLLPLSLVLGCTTPTAPPSKAVLLSSTAGAVTDIAPRGAGARGIDDATVEKAYQKLQEEYRLTIDACSNVLSGFEDKADRITLLRTILTTVGTSAGAIAIPALSAAAPLANNVAVSALGGVSGATNAVLGSLSEGGLTAADTLLARQATRANLRTALNKYYTKLRDGKTPENIFQAGVAIDEAKAECKLYEVNGPKGESSK